MSKTAPTLATDLCRFIDAAPTPYHATRVVAEHLREAGFRRLEEGEDWEGATGRLFIERGGGLIAWVRPEALPAHAGFRVIGAHTDSPNLRVKPNPDRRVEGLGQIGVEVYGGSLVFTWMDRDLGLAGRALIKSDHGIEERLFHLDRALFRIPNLAIHLNRGVVREGLVVDLQQHLAPIYTDDDSASFLELVGEALGVKAKSILSWDAMLCDVQPSTLAGRHGEFISAPRLDNLASSFVGLKALLARLEDEAANALGCVPVLALFDHEEIGSLSHSGADGPLLADLLERIVDGAGGGVQDLARAKADSFVISVDMAHATHPNYADRHEPEHRIRLNGGPVLKINANVRYASDGPSEAAWLAACEETEVSCQRFVMRSDLGCGSTIGPITAAKLGVSTVDVGMPQLAMHSCRETMGAHDLVPMRRVLTALLT